MKYHNHESELEVEQRTNSETYVKLSRDRIIFISEDFTPEMASEVSALLLYYDKKDHNEPIKIYINSSGGDGTALVNIYDVVQMIKAPVSTTCIGKCYSAGAVLLAAGSKGMRYAFKNSNIMIHGIQCIFPLPGHDVIASKKYYDLLISYNDSIMKMLAKHTNHPFKKVKEDCMQDVYMTALEAKKYGIIDHVI